MNREILGIALLVTQAGTLFPLVWELWKSRSSKGISLLGESIWVSAGLGWVMYGWMTNSKVLMASGSIAFFGSLAVVVLIYSDTSRKARSNAFWIALGCLVTFIVSASLWGVMGLIVTLSFFGAVQFIPQLVTSIKSIQNRNAHGTPMIGTSMRALYTLTWAVYAGGWFLWGLTSKDIDYPLVVWGLVGCVAFSLQFVAGMLAKQE